jgi:DNA-binding MarR family transcriptional regulator
MPRTASDRQTDVIDAVVGASRVLVGLAARSLGPLNETVTLTQYRVLVVLATNGPQRVADLAAALNAEPSTATRLCDRLARKKLVRRQRMASDRRTVQVAISETGRQLVAEVMDRRRMELSRILRRISPGDQEKLIEALRTFNEAAGEAPDHTFSIGWTS